MAKLIDITGKALSGEWGSEDVSGQGIPILRTTNFTNEGTIDYSSVVTRTVTKKNIRDKFLKNGDIIIEKSGGSDKQPVGRVVYFDSIENKYLFNNFTGLLRVKDKNKWLPKYVFYSLFSAYKQGKTKYFENRTTGLHNLQTDSYIKNLEIKDVPIHVQQKECDILDNICGQVMLRKKQLSQYDQIVNARFIEMFGDPSVNPKGWPLRKLGNLGELNRGVSKHRPRNAPELLGGIYPLIQTGDVANSATYISGYTSTYSELGLKQSRMWPKGTLCITIAANIAKTGILDFDACFPDSVVGFIPDKIVDTLYIHYWFSFFQKILEEQAPQSAQKNINLKILRDLNVMVPPYGLQEQFINFVYQVNKSKSAIQKSLDETQTLFNSLMQEYFG